MVDIFLQSLHLPDDAVLKLRNEVGIEVLGDIHDVIEDDLVTAGLTRVQRRRFLRGVAREESRRTTRDDIGGVRTDEKELVHDKEIPGVVRMKKERALTKHGGIDDSEFKGAEIQV